MEGTAHAFFWRTLFGWTGLAAIPADGAAPSQFIDTHDGTITPFSVPLAGDGAREMFLGAAEGTIVGFSNPSSIVIQVRGGLKRYKVQKGDTLSRIAARFGISLETLRQANPDVLPPLRVGTELLVLPVSGMLYKVSAGDSLEMVAARYGVDPGAVRQYNADLQKIFTEGRGTLVLPNARAPRAVSAPPRDELPDLKGYFLLPAMGWNWGELHGQNAIDIGGKCDTLVRASADGLVMEAVSGGAWNGGYGNLVTVEHTNGTQTRYAHLGKVLVRVGIFVARGAEIGTMGETGASHGPTGCSLHFEVKGAKNPFAVR
ncbi:MAG: M23 family metallopeptidase [Candidatus Jorgensenbacteria bacterium]